MAKTMTLTDLGQLKRMMGMTTSANDHEALAALRKANIVIGRHGLTWEEILSKTVNVVGNGSLMPGNGSDIEYNVEIPLDDQIQRAFDEVRGNVSGDFAEFVESIETQFNKTRYLTPAQRAPLFKTVMQLREKRRRDA